MVRREGVFAVGGRFAKMRSKCAPRVAKSDRRFSASVAQKSRNKCLYRDFF